MMFTACIAEVATNKTLNSSFPLSILSRGNVCLSGGFPSLLRACLITHSQFVPALASTPVQDSLTILCFHSAAQTVFVRSLPLACLVCTFHNRCYYKTLLLCCFLRRRSK